MIKFLVDDLRGILEGGSSTESQSAINLPVEGMTCGGCVAKLQKRLLATDGIESAQVNLTPGSAVVAGSLDTAAITAIITDAGFRVPSEES
jgi:copper chaperone CopZ